MVNATVNLRINKDQFDKLINDASNITDDAAKMMAENMKKSILTGAKSGRQYGSHTASAPGQAPANDTGALVRSIKVEKKKNESTVYVEKDYAIYLEYGTSKMRPRPFILPAFLKTKKWFSDKLHRLAYRGSR